jgi:hypothetical protein
MKMKNKIFAIPVAAAAMPKRNTSAQRNMRTSLTTTTTNDQSFSELPNTRIALVEHHIPITPIRVCVESSRISLYIEVRSWISSLRGGTSPHATRTCVLGRPAPLCRGASWLSYASPRWWSRVTLSDAPVFALARVSAERKYRHTSPQCLRRGRGAEAAVRHLAGGAPAAGTTPPVGNAPPVAAPLGGGGLVSSFW